MSQKEIILQGRAVAPGNARAKVVASKQPFMFAHGVEPKTGEVIDKRSDIAGENVKGKILFFPFGKGSTTGSGWLLETIRQGNGPAAIINVETEPIIVTGVTLGRILYHSLIPIVDRLEENATELITRGVTAEVNGDLGQVRIIS